VGGKSGGGSQLVGYAYYLDMAYAFSEGIDHLYGFYLQETRVWSGDITTNGASFQAKTGQTSETYGSTNTTSPVYVYLGSQTSPNSYLTQKTGLELIYKNVAYLVFPQVFIGDNVRNVPTYGVLIGKTSIPSCASLTNYATYKNIVGKSSAISTNSTPALPVTTTDAGTIVDDLAANATVVTFAVTNANPAYIIYDILTNLVKVSPFLLDSASFSTAAATLYSEKLGMSIVINTSKKAIDWIKEILRYIDGVVYFNNNIGKYSLNLLRDDYTIENLPSVSVDIASNIKFSRSSRADLPNTFTFKYTNITGDGIPKIDTVSLTNQANLNVAGFVKNVDVDLTCVNTDEALAYLTTMQFKKQSYPLASLTFNISPLDFPDFMLGAAFTFSDDILTAGASLVFRVTKVTGDKDKDDYYGIEAIEDIFNIGELIQLPSSIPISVQPTYELSAAPNRLKIFPVTPENALEKSVFVAATYPSTGNYVRNLVAYELTSLYLRTPEWSYGTVKVITNNTGAVLDRDLIIQVENLDKDLYQIIGTAADLHRVVYTAYWGDEAIAFQTVTKVSDTIFEFSGIIRGVQDKVTAHSIGEAFWVAPVSANSLPVLKITSTSPNIKVFAENPYSRSAEINTNHTYNYGVETPYKINSLLVVPLGTSGDLKWSPCVRLKGANYRNCDTIVAGEDEGVFEGIYNIYKNSILIATISPPTSGAYCTYNITTTGTYDVEVQEGPYKSPKVTKVVVAADFIV